MNTKCVDEDNNNIGDKDADENNDGEISQNEANLVFHLVLREINISSIDELNYFKNLITLDSRDNYLKKIEIFDLFFLKSVKCASTDILKIRLNNLIALENIYYYGKFSSGPTLDSLTINNSPKLKGFDFDGEELRYINISNCNSIKTIDCSKNQVNTLILHNLEGLTSINVSYNYLTNLILTNLDSLEIITSNNNLLPSLTLSNFPNLKEIDCSYNKINSLQLTKLDKLESLKCHKNQIGKLELSDFPKLNYILCSSNLLHELNLNNLAKLNELIVSYNNLNYLDLNDLISLKTLNCKNNFLSSITFTNTFGLISIDCSYNKIGHLDGSKLSNLTSLNCANNLLVSITLNQFSNINYINCDNNFLSNLDLSAFSNLERVFCKNNKLKILNCERNNKLRIIDCSNNGFLESLFIKTGNPISTIRFNESYSLKYICCNESEIDTINAMKALNHLDHCEVNPYCIFTPGFMYYSLIGQNVLNINSNDCTNKDFTIPKLKYKIYADSISGSLISNNSGNYFIAVREGSYTIKPFLENPEYFNVFPDSITVTFPSASDTFIQDFCITPKGTLKQIDLSIIPTTAARPGFDASYKVVMTNKGNQVENGVLYFAYDEPRMDFISTDVNPSVQSDGLLSWKYKDLLPFETRYYNVTLNVNSPGETPPVHVRDELLITCNILDNVFLLKQEVVGSYDPNDKTCLEGKTITPEQVGEYVHYLIRFENTGNYAAENVVVKDVLDESTFDISTLQITDASHEAWARINGNVVEFIFEKIQLPFDDASNDGYICFKIKTKPTLVLGNELKNEANIYFDYNLPILTNKTNTVVANPVSTDEAIGESDIKSFPNPVSDVLKFSDDAKILKVEIFDLSGRLVQVSSVVNGEVNVEGLLSGAYRLKVYTQLGIRNGKMVKI